MNDAALPPVWRSRAVWLAVAATFGWRWLLAARTPVPNEDGVTYLWMAQHFAAFDFHGGFGEVFPPGLSLLLAPWLCCGGDPFAIAQTFGIACAAATVLPLVAIARHLLPRTGDAAAAVAIAWLWASGSLLARNAVEVMSEPPFLLLMALGTLAGLRSRFWLGGLCAGLAYWVRPEGVLLPIAFLLSHRRAALPALLPSIAAVPALGLARWLAGQGCDPLPLLAFHELRDDLPERGHVFGNLAQVPAAWFEAFGVTGLLLVAAQRRWRERAVQALDWQWLLQIGAVCTFVVRRRFLLSAAIAVHALAVPALAMLRPRWRNLLVAALVLAGAIGGYRGTISADRLAERDLGRWLGAHMTPAETVVSDMARVVWYAGRRPPPPRRLPTEELRQLTRASDVRFVVLGSKREAFEELRAAFAPTFAPVSLPDELALRAAERGIAVFERR